MTAPLTEDEVRVVDETWSRVAVPVGRRLQGVGCGLAFVGMAGLTLTPAIGNYVDIETNSAYGVLGIAILLLGAGAALGLFGATRDRPQGVAPVLEAADRVARARDAASGPAIAEATVLLALLRDVGQAEPPPGWTDRLGAGLEDVQRVQAYLVGSGKLAPNPRGGQFR
jgi:hypothetical protein